MEDRGDKIVPKQEDHLRGAQGEAVTRPAIGTNIGARTEELNDEYKNSTWFRKLKLEAEKKGWTREQLDKAVRAYGIR